MNLEELAERRRALEASFRELEAGGRALDARSDRTLSNLREIADETLRVARVAHDAPRILEELDAEFESKTGLGGMDVRFLFLAVALQCARQYLLPNDAFRLTASEGDRLARRAVPKSWQDVLLAPVPYDAIRTDGGLGGAGLSGYTHRYRTLGHDPVMGWIFGPVNILSDSLTKYDLTSYAVRGMVICEPVLTPRVFAAALEGIGADPYNLPAVILRQAIHFGTDYFTKQGLPLPFVGTLNNDLARTLVTRFGIDMWSVTRGAAAAALINAVIAQVHRLFYDPAEDGAPRLYEVRTRKILLYSNLIASASNVIYVAVRSYLGDASALKKLDAGGLLVTLWRLVTDIRFIHQVKREFIMESFNEMIRGKEYSFERETEDGEPAPVLLADES